MIDIPDMPADWWPEIVVVTGKTHQDGRMLQLAFAMTSETVTSPNAWEANLDGLRFALWRAKHDPAAALEASK